MLKSACGLDRPPGVRRIILDTGLPPSKAADGGANKLGSLCGTCHKLQRLLCEATTGKDSSSSSSSDPSSLQHARLLACEALLTAVQQLAPWPGMLALAYCRQAEAWLDGPEGGAGRALKVGAAAGGNCLGLQRRWAVNPRGKLSGIIVHRVRQLSKVCNAHGLRPLLPGPDMRPPGRPLCAVAHSSGTAGCRRARGRLLHPQVGVCRWQGPLAALCPSAVVPGLAFCCLRTTVTSHTTSTYVVCTSAPPPHAGTCLPLPQRGQACTRHSVQQPQQPPRQAAAAGLGSGLVRLEIRKQKGGRCWACRQMGRCPRQRWGGRTGGRQRCATLTPAPPGGRGRAAQASSSCRRRMSSSSGWPWSSTPQLYQGGGGAWCTPPSRHPHVGGDSTSPRGLWTWVQPQRNR